MDIKSFTALIPRGAFGLTSPPEVSPYLSRPPGQATADRFESEPGLDPQVLAMRRLATSRAQGTPPGRAPGGVIVKGPTPKLAPSIALLQSFCGKWDGNKDGKLTRKEVGAGLKSENTQERAAAETVLLLVDSGRWPPEGLPIGVLLATLMGQGEVLEKTLKERQRDSQPLPRFVLEGRQPTTGEAMLAPMSAPLLKFAGKLSSAADKLKHLSRSPRLAHLGPLGNILSGLSSTARSCAGGDADQVAKDLGSAVKSALSLMDRAFPKEVAGRLGRAVRIGRGAIPGVGMATSFGDFYLSRKKSEQAERANKQEQAALWDVKAALDGLIFTAQGGAFLSAGGEVVSILGRNPAAAAGSATAFTAVEGVCLVLGIAAEIVASSAES